LSEEYRYLGKATPRKDARDIVTGRAKYIDDMKVPGMLYGRVLRSPYPHANIRAIDTSRAEAFPGVRAVLTYKNVPDWKAGLIPHIRVLDSKVRFVGDAVALVAAETEDIAEEALGLIDVEYEQLPAVFEIEDAMKPGAPQLYAEFPGNIIPRDPRSGLFGTKTQEEVVMGDVEKGFKEADVIAEGTCSYENVPNPLPPEPPGAIVDWQSPDNVTIYLASQSAPLARLFLQPFLKLVDVRVISAQCGGSYGTKQDSILIVAYAAALSRATARPVKIYYTKAEHFNAYLLRLGSRVNARVGIKKDGTVTALSADWLVNTGASSQSSQAMVAVGCGEAQLMLRCPNWNLQPRIIFTNRNPSGVVRGFGGQELKSALIPILTLAMEKAGLDPVEFFKKNFVKAGDGYYWHGNWWVSRGVDFSKAMQQGAEAFGWKDKWKGWGIPTAVEGTKRTGVGVGLHGNADVGEDDSEASVKLTPDARAVLSVCVSESGIGERSNLCKMVAEVLNLPLERVKITPPDTLVNPFEFGLTGSRGTYAVGSAVIRAAEDARRKLLELAAPVLGEKAEELETRDGQIYVKSNVEKTLPWRKVMGLTRTCTGQGRHEADYSLSNFMMIFTEVEVDTVTGKVELKRVLAATDCGQIIDPLVLTGQLHGALGSAGIDTALFEESILDKSTGRILNGNMIDFKWRTFIDLPEFQTVILETPMPSHRFHAVGVGEISTAPGPSAVLMAIYNAIGQRIMDYPATPDKILKALGKS
jgi:CO/xanthine dehydrogenase Mo-binding subunit